MGTLTELICHNPGPAAMLRVRPASPIAPDRNEVMVRVQATSVNPIDAKRAEGYGRRLFSALGSPRNAFVPGNDFAGEIVAVGTSVKQFVPGDQVFGVMPTGPIGAHRDEIVVRSSLVRLRPAGFNTCQAAVLPYTFCTLWRALQAIGLNDVSARQKRILIHGASGALGQMAIQLLSLWGAHLTAVCSARHHKLCQTLGADVLIDRHSPALKQLPAIFDVTLNFGDWADDPTLVNLLCVDALGHATTVHPLLSELDWHGWIGGSRRLIGTWLKLRKLVRQHGPAVRYAWVVFKPDPKALDLLVELMESGRIRLAVGPMASLTNAQIAYEHVKKGSPLRAVLIPNS